MIGIPPWLNVRPTDFLQATEAGASAGGEAARLSAQAAEASRREAMAVMENQTRLQMEQAQLQQQHEQAMQAAELRKQIQQQQAMQDQQRINIDQAYKTSVAGLRKQQLDQMAQVNQLRAQAAAQKYAAQSKFAAALASGVPVDQALFQSPELVTPQAAVAATKASASKDAGPVTPQNIPGVGTVLTRPGSPAFRLVPRTLTPEQKIKDQTLASRITRLNAKIVEIESGGATEGDATLDLLNKQLQDVERQRLAIIGATPSVPKAAVPSLGKRFKYDPKTGNLVPVNENNLPPKPEDTGEE